MAEIFTKIFGEKLAKENLVETNNLDRLPSPHQLQGKIILKAKTKQEENSNEEDGTEENDLSEVIYILFITSHTTRFKIVFRN